MWELESCGNMEKITPHPNHFLISRRFPFIFSDLNVPFLRTLVSKIVFCLRKLQLDHFPFFTMRKITFTSRPFFSWIYFSHAKLFQMSLIQMETGTEYVLRNEKEENKSVWGDSRTPWSMTKPLQGQLLFPSSSSLPSCSPSNSQVLMFYCCCILNTVSCLDPFHFLSDSYWGWKVTSDTFSEVEGIEGQGG